ncbi:RNA recognition motif (RRM)-containing protein [Striga asiatica]|uniref:RNA recognition motif (RRM)-containing protein n=1 Tax=Striga asiatica TaxID=4170 RepID=A0A5A7PH25_STRAF|nr:RNA recognition motif (RRM)-containing protein [Striga asiatica]
MNPLTLVKRIQNINKKEASLGISEEASWHAKYKDSAYVYVGGIPFDLTEGDLLAVFAEYGEIVDVNLIRDKGTGKSKGFCFIAYEDQRSTNLAVDNLNGAQILGRIIRVDHVSKYKKLEEEDEETKQRKREERGVCRAFQKGECNRGDSCRFSHDQQRAADTGWGAEEDRHSRWVQEDSKRSHTNYSEWKDSMKERDCRNDKRSRKYESESYHRGDKYGRESSSRSGRDSENHRVRARDGHE